MRLSASLLWLAACQDDDAKCGPYTQEVDGQCVTGGTSSSTTPSDAGVGNQVPLSRFPPAVLQTVPATGSILVDPLTTRVEVTFSRAMNQDSWSWVSVDDTFPDTDGASFVDADTAQLNIVGLQPDRVYQLWVNSPSGTYVGFMDRDGLSAVAYPIVFATGSDPALLNGTPAAVIASDPPPGATDVDPALTRLQVSFSRDMDEAYLGWEMETPRTFPVLLERGFSDPRTAWVDVALEPATTYALWAEGFVGADGAPAAPWLMTFRTADP